jgi:hypothetical protein
MDDLQKELGETITERGLLYARVNLLDKKIRDLELKIRLIGMTEVKSAVKVMTDTWEGNAAVQIPAQLPTINEEHVEIPLKDLPIGPKKEELPQPPTGWFSLWGRSPPVPEQPIEDGYVKLKS